MKKILAFLLVLSMVILPIAACSPQTEAPVKEEAEEVVTEEKAEEKAEEQEEEKEEDKEEATEEAAEGAEVAAGQIAKVGLGLVSSNAKSKDGAEGSGAVAQADTTLAAVGFDAEGKIVSVTVDVAQTKVEFAEDGTFAADLNADVQSKKERGADYGMAGASEIGKEWFEQMEAFEEWMIGKTAEEVIGIAVKERDDAHKSVPDIPDLTSSVTITVESYQAAVKEAWDNAQDVEGAVKVGLGVVTSTMRSKELEEGNGMSSHINTTAAAVALDAEDKVVKAIVDVIQNQVKFDDEGVIDGDVTVEPKSKLDLGDEYGMKGASSIEKEWHEQIAEFTKWMEGKTIDEINGLAVKERDEGHKSVPDIPDLTSSVTITVEDYQAAVTEAAKLAR